jgi:5'-nucleotidase (lipoprotein e(P4) family)
MDSIDRTGRARRLHAAAAIIVDVDETVLDNSPYQARLILEGGLYNEDSWREWVDAAEAEPLAGAVTFLQTAAARGVTVFYVTNRDVSGKEATRANLLAAGFPIDRTREVLLLKGENGWTSGKTARRALIAKDFRIVMLAGDDLNDFFPARTEHPDPRKADVEEYADWFGERWIVLPNPTYGSWEASLFGRDYELSPEAKRAKMLEHLRPW